MKLRPTGGRIRGFAPILLTGAAAALGYAFAVYPIWRQAHAARDMTTNLRSAALDAYTESGVAGAGFDKITWVVPTVMTPFVGYAPAPGRQRNAFISRNQFRGERELTTPKTPGVTRVVVTGGSVAFGLGAPGDDGTIAAYLQHALDRLPRRKYEVFTFAAPGWASTHARIAVENRISEIEPDVVVWLTGNEDLSASEIGRNVLWSRSRTEQYYWDLANMALKKSGWGQMVDVQDVSSVRVPPEIVASRLRRNVDLAGLALSMRNARLLVFLEPNIVTTRKPLSAWERTLRTIETTAPFGGRQEYYPRCLAAIEALFRGREFRSNVTYTDLTGIFDAFTAERSVFADGFHFGDRGNSILADAIGNALSAVNREASRTARR